MTVQTFHLTGDARTALAAGPITATGIYLEDESFVGGSRVYLAEYRSFTTPRRLMHGGWIALGGNSVTNRPKDHILWYKYLEFEAEWIKLSPSVVADYLEYHLPAGFQWQVVVNY